LRLDNNELEYEPIYVVDGPGPAAFQLVPFYGGTTMKHFRACVVWPVGALVLCGLGLTVGSAGDRQGAKPDKAAREQLLAAVGTLGAAHLHQTYLNIGFIADGKAEGTYGAKDAEEILKTVRTIRETVDKQLARVAKLELGANDRKSLLRLRKISALLDEQAGELQAFWQTGNKDRAAAYERCRKQAWEEIQNLAKPAAGR
jgi:hypothetical protein